MRLPVFVDRVQTEYGIADPCAEAAIAYQQKIQAEKIALLVDVHVKHARTLSEHSLELSIKNAVESGADGIIITGKWTGDPPTKEDLETAANVSQRPIFAGSGVNEKNLPSILTYAHGVIVSTALKQEGERKHRQNIVHWDRRIDKEKVQNFIRAATSNTSL